MDLLNIRENLERNAYTDPNKMAADMKLMFTNSKSFNTNKRSRVSKSYFHKLLVLIHAVLSDNYTVR